MSIRAAASSIAEAWSAGAVLMYIDTTEEVRAQAVVAAAAKHHGAAAHVWTATRGIEGVEKDCRGVVAALAEFSHGKGPGVLAMLDPTPWLDDPVALRGLRDTLPGLAKEHKCIVLVGAHASLPPSLSDACVQVALPPPDQDELLELAHPYYSHLDEASQRNIVTAALGLSEERAQRAFRARGGVHSVLVEKGRSLAKGSALSAIEERVSFDHVGGLSALKEWLDRRRDAFSAEARAFGLPAPKGALLCGVQGCGKSLSAKAVAEHWSLPLLRLDFGAVFGGTLPPEAALTQALETAESLAPAVLWIDEIEKGLAGADPESDMATPVAARVLGTFATWLQEKENSVFVMATANEVKTLPPELLRKGRFDEVFFVDLPEQPVREDILAVHLTRRGRDASQFELGPVAKAAEHFSGAELEQVVVSALHTAFSNSREVTANDLRRAAEEMVPLYATYEERVKSLRTWARDRARPANKKRAAVDILLGARGT